MTQIYYLNSTQAASIVVITAIQRARFIRNLAVHIVGHRPEGIGDLLQHEYNQFIALR